MLEINLFGHFQVLQDGVELHDIHVQGANWLLAYMALQDHREVSIECVNGAVWPENMEPSVRKGMEHLRSVLGSDKERIKSANRFIRLNLLGCRVDALEFDVLYRRKTPETDREAFNLYTSPILLGWDTAQPWVVERRTLYATHYRHLIDRMVQHAHERNLPLQAIDILSIACGVHPENQDWWSLLIELHTQQHNYIQALATGKRYLAWIEQQRRETQTQFAPSPTILAQLDTLRTQLPPVSPNASPSRGLIEEAGGVIAPNSPFYVVRPEEVSVRAGIIDNQHIITIRGARQTGKSSMLARIAHTPPVEGIQILRTDWQSLSRTDLIDELTFYRALATSLADQARLDIDLNNLFPTYQSPSAGFEKFIRDRILNGSQSPILWLIDDADSIFSCPFRDDVFRLLRGWYNKHFEAPWSRLTMVLTYTAEAHLSIQDLNGSPFNVGQRVVLSDFTSPQVEELNVRYGSPLSKSQLRQLTELVAGHPYLILRALQGACRAERTIETILKNADLPGGIYVDHLQRLLDNLRADGTLCEEVSLLLAGKQISEEGLSRLYTSGLLVGDANQKTSFRCQLYERFLRRRLQ